MPCAGAGFIATTGSRLAYFVQSGPAQPVLPTLLPKSYFQLPRFAFQFWNTNVLDRAAPVLPSQSRVGAVAIVVFAVALLRKTTERLGLL